MNILMISKIDLSRPTGETEHFLGLATGFTKLGHKVLLLCPKPSSRLKNINNKINYIFVSSTQNRFKSFIFQLLLFFYLPILFLRYKINFVYIRQGPFLLIPALLSRFFAFYTATEINGLLQEDMKILYNPSELIMHFSEICEKLSYKFSNKIIAVTPQLKYFIKQKYSIPDSKICVVSNGVNTDFYTMEKIRHEYFNVLFMGSNAKWQGLDVLLETIDAVNTRKLPIKFIIVTNKQVYEKNTECFVNIEREAVKNLLKKIDIAVAPYKKFRNNASGISPIKVFTYLSSGIPVIVSNIGEIGHEIESNNAGIVIESDNPGKLSGAIIHMYRNGKKTLEAMSENARLMAEKYDWKIVASKIIDFVYN